MIHYQNAVFSRTRDRLPHNGPALFGPWSPHWWEIPVALHRARDTLVVIVAAIAFAVAWWLP
jgi:hypothetical protein